MESHTGITIAGLFFFLVLGAIVLSLFVFWIWMLIHAITNNGLRDVEKLIWVVVILILHFLGALIYFFVGRPRQATPAAST